MCLGSSSPNKGWTAYDSFIKHELAIRSSQLQSSKLHGSLPQVFIEKHSPTCLSPWGPKEQNHTTAAAALRLRKQLSCSHSPVPRELLIGQVDPMIHKLVTTHLPWRLATSANSFSLLQIYTLCGIASASPHSHLLGLEMSWVFMYIRTTGLIYLLHLIFASRLFVPKPSTPWNQYFQTPNHAL